MDKIVIYRKTKKKQKFVHAHTHNLNHNKVDSASQRYPHTRTRILNRNVLVLRISQNLIDGNMLVANRA